MSAVHIVSGPLIVSFEVLRALSLSTLISSSEKQVEEFQGHHISRVEMLERGRSKCVSFGHLRIAPVLHSGIKHAGRREKSRYQGTSTTTHTDRRRIHTVFRSSVFQKTLPLLYLILVGAVCLVFDVRSLFSSPRVVRLNTSRAEF